jgi:hypothetical protein
MPTPVQADTKIAHDCKKLVQRRGGLQGDKTEAKNGSKPLFFPDYISLKDTVHNCLHSLSEERHALVIRVTQAKQNGPDAQNY